MASLLHELWIDTKGLHSLCINGPEGDGFRSSLLKPGSRLIRIIKASSHFNAMTEYYKLMGWGKYKTELLQYHKPYTEDRLIIQEEWKKAKHSKN